MYARILITLVIAIGLAVFIKGPIRKWIGIALVVVALVIGGGIGLNMMGGEPSLPMSENIVLLIIMGVVPFALGTYMILAQKADSLKVEQDYYTKKVVSLAKRNGGKLTPLDLSQETDLSVNDARSKLEQLQIQQVVYPDVLENGVLVYRLLTAESIK